MSNHATIPAEATNGIRDAETFLMREAERLEAFVPPDPAAKLVRAMAAMAQAQNRLAVASDLAQAKNRSDVETMIKEARKPWTPGELTLLSQQLRTVLMHQWVRINRYAIALGIAIAFLLAVLLAVVVYDLAGGFQITCHVQNGGRFCGYWADPPK